MQTSTIHPPATAARMRNTNIGAHSKGNGNPKALRVQSVPSDETGKALSQAPLSFCAVASNLDIDTWSDSRTYFPNFSYQ